MAGITDLPFRLLNRRFGCALAFVEMLNVRSVSFKGRKTLQMLSSHSQDRPLGVQILGCEEKFILRALEVLKRFEFDLLDFNAACPVKKVVRRGEGAGLLKEPKKLGRLLKIIVGRSEVPVSVKIRSGWDADSRNAREVALTCEDAGIDGLCIHGRTKAQGYGGSVDYKIIREVKKAVKIPVIASGDILSVLLAKKMFEETGCDGLSVARGALGNPWIFQEIAEYLKSGRLSPRPGEKEIIRVILEHLQMCLDFYGERIGVMLFRKFFTWYTKGFRKIRPWREKCSRAKTKQEMFNIIAGCEVITAS